MKTAISVPDHLFDAADRLAEERGWSRSHLYSEALATYIGRHEAAAVTAKLNVVYADGESLDPVIGMLQDRSLDEDAW